MDDRPADPALHRDTVTGSTSLNSRSRRVSFGGAEPEQVAVDVDQPDPDGYLWEIAWGAFEFSPDASLRVT